MYSVFGACVAQYVDGPCVLITFVDHLIVVIALLFPNHHLPPSLPVPSSTRLKPSNPPFLPSRRRRGRLSHQARQVYHTTATLRPPMLDMSPSRLNLARLHHLNHGSPQASAHLKVISLKKEFQRPARYQAVVRCLDLKQLVSPSDIFQDCPSPSSKLFLPLDLHKVVSKSFSRSFFFPVVISSRPQVFQTKSFKYAATSHPLLSAHRI
jgi:hypothetical protein